MLDSICTANGYSIDIYNKSSFIECLKQNPGLVFDSIRIIDKGMDNEDIEWQILFFRIGNDGLEFYFKKTLDNKWVLFQPHAIYEWQ